MAEYLGTRLQEDIIVVLCWHTKQAQIIRNLVAVEMFEREYREIAHAVYKYLDDHSEAPQAHTPDIIEPLWNSDDKVINERYIQLLKYIQRAGKKKEVNVDYTMQRLTDFMISQSDKAFAIDIVNFAKDNNSEGITKICRERNNLTFNSFDAGTFLSDISRAFEFLDNDDRDTFLTGVKEFDYRKLGPRRRELYLFIASMKHGKTWWMVNLAKRAIMQRHRVVHITLEAGERTVMTKRYYQAFFEMANKDEKRTLVQLGIDDVGKLIGMSERTIRPQYLFDAPDIRDKLGGLVDLWRSTFDRIIIKEFPTGSFTMEGLYAYLDLLEEVKGFVPDLLIVDYADLFDLPHIHKETRHALDILYKELRGLAVRRDIALVTASQADTASGKAGKVGAFSASEDKRKVAHADTVVTYSQTEQEHNLQIARLKMAAARNEADGMTVVITQNYTTGQFLIQSARMNYPLYAETMKQYKALETGDALEE